MWCLLMGNLLEGCYREEKLHSLNDITMMGEVTIISSGGIAVTDMEMASLLTPKFPAASYLPPTSDCLNFCVQNLSLPLSLPP